ncbi:MAG: prolipoprotein diacylglyceryl transferase [Clostridia bacterium]|nr:prolipoprotein diacylglyceryl transferase [Clostridia bacterium]
MKAKIFGFIPVYGLLIACAIGMAVALCEKECRRRGMKEDTGIDMALYAVPAAIIGARLYYVIFQWPYFARDPWAILRVWEGGLAIYGAVIGGAIGLAILAARRKMRYLMLLDIVAPVVLLGQAIGRWGNFFNGEAYGYQVTNAALQFFPLSVQVDGSWHLATFFYESVWNALGFVLLWRYRKRIRLDGDVFFGYLLWYGAGRLFIEGLRTDSLMLFNLRVSQLLSLGMCAAAAFVQGRRHRDKMLLVLGGLGVLQAVVYLWIGQTYMMLLPSCIFAALMLRMQKARR